MEKITISTTISTFARVRNLCVNRAMPASNAPVLMVTVMKAPMARTKKNTWAAPNSDPSLYGPVLPGAVTTSAGVPSQMASASACCSGVTSSAGSETSRMPYNPLTGDSHRSYSRSLKVMLVSVCWYDPGIGLALPPSQETYWYAPGLITNVRANTNSRTKNKTV